MEAQLEFEFDGYRLDVARKMLWKGQDLVQVGHRAISILSALLETPRATVSKRRLFDCAWPGVVVDEANLRVQVANLRKALGSSGRLIVTEQSLGYSFQSEVRRSEGRTAAETESRLTVPSRLTRFVGREALAATILSAFGEHRLITVVGAGGIGKTTMALEVARRAGPDFSHGSCLVDLSLSASPDDAAAALAIALEQPVLTDPLSDVLTFLKRRQLLIVLDCCERIVDAAAMIAEAVLMAAPDVTIVATSREVLRVPGEFVQMLDGLEQPPSGAIAAEAAARYGAVALFAQTAASNNASFELTDQNAAVVGDICRRLDGIPLAVDLAAGLTSALALDEILNGLDERISVLTLGRRTGLPRHRTLDATIAWSYDRLSDREATTLRRLSVFAGVFTLSFAVEVVAFGDLTASDAKMAIVSLAQKSLLNVDTRVTPPEYRLLETTRHFADERTEASERHDTFASHAARLLHALTIKNWDGMDAGLQRRSALNLVADVRAALTWAYSDQSEPLLPVRLTVAAEPILLQSGLYAEQEVRMHQALEQMKKGEDQDEAVLASVLTGVAYGVMYNATDDTRIQVVQDAIAASERVGDTYRLMRNLAYAHYFFTIRHRGEALSYADRLLQHATSCADPDMVAFAHILTAVSDVQRGEWANARRSLEPLVARQDRRSPRLITTYFGLDPASFALFELATLDCLQGYASACFANIELALALTEERQHALNRFQVLYFGACFLSFACGDLERARSYLEALRQHARDFAPWILMSLAYEGWLALLEGRFAEARDHLERYLAFDVPSASLIAAFKLALSRARLALGDLTGALDAVDDTFSRRIGEVDPIIIGPALCTKADILASEGSDAAAAEAKRLYADAIANARLNDALTFEIPAACGLARLLNETGDRAAALAVLRETDELGRRDEALPGLREVRRMIGEIA